jgi:CheY-like chemotaxis protein
MLRDGTIAPEEVVVINCSGHTIPAESHILGDQYDKYILDLELNKTATAEFSVGAREEGLGAALKNLHEQVTTIVIVDDNANDRRLIRRLLQSYKNYRVYEASNGQDGLEVIRDRQPDLVVTDLTMPEMDGFMLLEQLKHDPEIAHIPVVVVSAKALTAQDRKLLENYSSSVWTKGGFETRQLVDHVVTTLGHTPVEVIRNERRLKSEQFSESPIHSNGSVIVVIDDNPNDLRLARRMLETNPDYHVIEAMTGRDGLKAIYSYHPDLIVLDVMLPDMDGFSIIETLQRDSKLRDIPVVVFSAKDFDAKQREQMRSSIRRILEKATLNQEMFMDVIKTELG